MANQGLRLQLWDAQQEIVSLKEERALLSGRIEKRERAIRAWIGMMQAELTGPMEFTPYAPGILQMTPVAAPPPIDRIIRPPRPAARARTASKPSHGDLAGLANRMLKAIVEAEPARISPTDLAEQLGLSAEGGHFKRGLAALRKTGFVEMQDSSVRRVQPDPGR